MIRDDGVIREINELWAPVYPAMVDHVLGASGLTGGEVLDLGPFAGGLAVEVLRRGEGFRGAVQDAFPAVPLWAEARAREAGVAGRLTTLVAGWEPLPWPGGRFDLVLVRGAFFFLGAPLLREVGRVLRPGGLGWVGGGYGPATPPGAIEPIAARSRWLNALLGKRRVSRAEAEALVAAAGLRARGQVRESGGLWIEVRG